MATLSGVARGIILAMVAIILVAQLAVSTIPQVIVSLTNLSTVAENPIPLLFSVVLVLLLFVGVFLALMGMIPGLKK